MAVFSSLALLVTFNWQGGGGLGTWDHWQEPGRNKYLLADVPVWTWWRRKIWGGRAQGTYEPSKSQASLANQG